MTGTLRDDQCAFLIIFRQVILKREILQTKVVEKIKTHILCSTTFSRKSRHFIRRSGNIL
jgi:hypothetical protein